MNPYRVPALRPCPGRHHPYVSRSPELLILLSLVVWASGLFGGPIWRGYFKPEAFICVWAFGYIAPGLLGVIWHAARGRADSE